MIRRRSKRVLLLSMLMVVAFLALRVTYGWRYASLDGVAANALLLLAGDKTSYGPGYSEAAFGALVPGSSSARVLELLGQPLWRVWWYPVTATGPNRCCVAYLDGAAEQVLRSDFKDIAANGLPSLVRSLHGEPAEETWVYAGRDWLRFDRGEESDHRVRHVIIRAGHVVRTNHEVSID
jgi:hypothetical protein